MRAPTTKVSRKIPNRHRWLLVAAVMPAGLVLGACGEDDDGTASVDVDDADLRVIARDIEFDQDSYRLPAGEPTIGYVQEGAVRHTLLIEGPGGDDVPGFELEVNGDESDAGSASLEPGTYTFYCDVAGHREAGMEAELVVE